MQLIEDKNKIYILFTNAEGMEERDNWNGWDGVHSTDKFTREFKLLCNRGRIISPVQGIQINGCYVFYGDKGHVEVKVDEVHEVHRAYPYDTTARAYWGEFRRKFHLNKIRCNKMVRSEINYVVEATLIDGEISNHYGFNSFGSPGRLIDPHTFAPRHKKQKTWNLSKDRFPGPNLKDYSINDCFKYYTLL